MEGLREPLAAPTRALLRRAVVELARAEQRRSFPAVLHVGLPGADPAELEVEPTEPYDPGLRADVVAALRVRSGTPGGLVWLTRPGGPAPEDVDGQWLSAARSAYDEAGVPLTFVVVTRRGWRDPRSGLAQSWVRLRA